MSFQAIAETWSACKRCKIGLFAFNHVFFDGSEKARVMFVGEGPGVSEDALGIPFVGPSGRLLREALKKVGLTSYCFTNLVACRPCDNPHGPNRAPTSEEILNCDDRLRTTVALVKPKLLVAVGQVPMTWLTENFSGYRIRKIKHPAYILRNGYLFLRYDIDLVGDDVDKMKCPKCGADMKEDWGVLICLGCGQDQNECECEPTGGYENDVGV